MLKTKQNICICVQLSNHFHCMVTSGYSLISCTWFCLSFCICRLHDWWRGLKQSHFYFRILKCDIGHPEDLRWRFVLGAILWGGVFYLLDSGSATNLLSLNSAQYMGLAADGCWPPISNPFHFEEQGCLFSGSRTGGWGSTEEGSVGWLGREEGGKNLWWWRELK